MQPLFVVMPMLVQIVRVVLLLGLLELAAACATSPTGRRQLILVPNAQMDRLGAEAFAALKQEEKIDADPAMRAYVQCVAAALTAQVHSRGTPPTWEVRLFDNPQVNAFALPGGKIGVYRGMLTVAATADQLAAVLAHEVGHVVAHHGAERLSQQVVAGLSLEAIQLAMQQSSKRRVILAALGVGAQLGVLLPFSRTHEREADHLGQSLMATAGFNPQASITLWQKMAQSGQKGPPEFLSTHPSHETRIKELQKSLPTSAALYRDAQQAGLKPNCLAPTTPD